eukprot:CAMPEP_0196780882 /NCGR_PEP_ID=MMETSP1104-20130614/8735_1 /TAXON_ID=33652 /ORGANISM="Cafeteria sp., Strain Caron Lab Isolate" /LENGTH=190 /DNA_ID=CAMNT_0042151097 /DNA_START=10 /DNA_END=582 /DNA_ORIENTATION=-
MSSAQAVPVEVLYCGVCSMPVEYCEYDPRFNECRKWLQAEHPDVFAAMYSDEALAEAAGELKVSDGAAAEEAKEAPTSKPARVVITGKKKKVAEADVLVKVQQRNKRKFVTHIEGLDTYDLKLKAVAKELGRKCSCGSSVSALATGAHEIIVQGSVHDNPDMLMVLVEKFGVPKERIFIVDGARKKPALS